MVWASISALTTLSRTSERQRRPTLSVQLASEYHCARLRRRRRRGQRYCEPTMSWKVEESDSLSELKSRLWKYSDRGFAVRGQADCKWRLDPTLDRALAPDAPSPGVLQAADEVLRRLPVGRLRGGLPGMTQRDAEDVRVAAPRGGLNQNGLVPIFRLNSSDRPTRDIAFASSRQEPRPENRPR